MFCGALFDWSDKHAGEARQNSHWLFVLSPPKSTPLLLQKLSAFPLVNKKGALSWADAFALKAVCAKARKIMARLQSSSVNSYPIMRN